jgi:hypothetical protein
MTGEIEVQYDVTSRLYCEEKKEDITSRNVRKRGQRFLKVASALLYVRKKGNI